MLFPLGAIVLVANIILSCSADVAPQEYSRHQIRLKAREYSFDFVSWEIAAMSSLLGDVVFKRNGTDREATLRTQIETVVTDNGISIFPPLYFRLEEPPHMLVVSPRDRIVNLDRLLLRQELEVEEMEKLEAQVDDLGWSSLVVGLGGIGATYPPIILDDASITFTIDAVVEEWLHQYLTFRPLGFLYLLDSIGIKQQPDVPILNETVVGIVSKEIGSEVYERYYSAGEEKPADKKKQSFDFKTEMKETRRKTDMYLSQGDIEAAERYMEERRRVFVSHGYNIRKLNQAYFAFHGIYGSSPASVSPIYGDLKRLRGKCTSVKSFLDRTSSMTSYAGLKEALEE